MKKKRKKEREREREREREGGREMWERGSGLPLEEENRNSKLLFPENFIFKCVAAP
jgi:hypothetical protein